MAAFSFGDITENNVESSKALQSLRKQFLHSLPTDQQPTISCSQVALACLNFVDNFSRPISIRMRKGKLPTCSTYLTHSLRRLTPDTLHTLAKLNKYLLETLLKTNDASLWYIMTIVSRLTHVALKAAFFINASIPNIVFEILCSCYSTLCSFSKKLPPYDSAVEELKDGLIYLLVYYYFFYSSFIIIFFLYFVILSFFIHFI